MEGGKFTKVKSIFENVKEMRSEISVLFEGVDTRIKKLQDMYSEFINYTMTIKTTDVKSFIFSLDSFYFQSRLLKKEYNYLTDYNLTIINRMYGEYYKLFKLMTEYVDQSFDDKLNETLKKNNYPKYDDLDDSKQYSFDIIIQLNEDIVTIINFLTGIKNEKELSLKTYTTNQNYGLNVNNFVSTYNYEIVVLNEHINLYEKYLEFFYSVHSKLFKRLITKISLLEAQLNTDVKFEGGLLSRKKNKEVLFEEMNVESLNKIVARDIRKSIIGSVSPSVSNSSDNDDEVFLSINDIHSSKEDFNSNYITPIPINNESNNENITAAEKIFQKHNLITNEDELNNFIEHDEIPDYSHDENEIVVINNFSEEKIKQNIDIEEECIESDNDENITLSVDSKERILSAKQKKNLKKNIKKKEKKQKEKEDNEILDKIINELKES
jgi:hypothetical protein